MRRSKQFSPVRRWAVALLTLLCLSFSVASYSQVPTPEQLRMLQQLDPDQREQLLKALGAGGGANTQSSPPLQNVESPPLPDSLPLVMDEDSDEEERLGPHDSLLIKFAMFEEEKPELVSVFDALGRNLYQLDYQGYLNFPGVSRILLAGLTAEEARLRLSAVPEFRDVAIDVDLLPVIETGSVAVQPYGIDLFSEAPTTFAPATDIPIPQDYIVGPGDEISLQMFGNENAQYLLTIGRDGQVNIPVIGPVAVAGMRFNELKEELTTRIEERYIGVTVSITTGKLRSVRIFVLGDVNQPGSYTVSGLSTMTNALFVSGGIAESGSLRSIELKRNNRVISTLDLYDLLLKGNTKNDRRLQPGDVIYVPPVGPQVTVYGEVNRPAIYELRGSESLRDALALAGGVRPSASTRDVTIERFDQTIGKSVIVADLEREGAMRVKAGDQIEISPTLSQLTDAVFVRGHVKRAFTRQWRAGLRVLDVIPTPASFEVQADQAYILVRREDRSTGRLQLLSINWRAAFENPASSYNVQLQQGDTLNVFSLAEDRAVKVAPMIEELESQATAAEPSQTVYVNGRVRAPGEYPYEPGMRVADLVRAAGSAMDNAYLEEAELTRTFVGTAGRNSTHIPINLQRALVGGDEDKPLEPYDVLTVKEIPQWREQRQVEVSGEIKFPGIYAASRGERLSEVLRRAGGLTDMAFARGSVFLREDLKERERIQLEKLSQRIRTEISSFSDIQTEARDRASALLAELEKSEAVGRLVIDLNLVLQGDPEHDVVLEDGDQLIIPPVSQEITVIGEVQHPTSHIYERDLSQAGYLYKSGGVTANADMNRIYIIRADGNVVAQQGSRWFRRSSGGAEVFPGDTIVVPFDADRISKLTLWQTVSQIVYNIGVSAAAVASF